MAHETHSDFQHTRVTPSRVRPVLHALVITGGYVITAAAWIAISNEVLAEFTGLTDDYISPVNGAIFMLVTGAILFVIADRVLARLRDSEESFVEAQAQLHQKDLAVRQGYVDVLDAVTGGKLILITEDELDAALGELFMAPRQLLDASSVSEARIAISESIVALPLDDRDAVILAVSEALTNAVKHGGGDDYSIYLQARKCLQFVIRDYGPGIDFRSLPKATLIQGFSTSNTMGFGFTIMLEVCDRVLLTTDTRGTAVVLEVELAGVPAKEAARPLAEILP